MSEAAIDRREPCGTPLRGSDVGLPACSSCTHVHRVTDEIASSGIIVTYDISCPECPCTASGETYGRGVTDTADVASFDATHLTAVYDHDDEYCGSVATPDHDDDGPSFGPAPSPTSTWGDYAADALSTNTVDWACIRQWESGDTYTDYSGAYGFEGADYSSMPPAQQDAYALEIFHQNGDHFAGAWNDRCTEVMGLG